MSITILDLQSVFGADTSGFDKGVKDVEEGAKKTEGVLASLKGAFAEAAIAAPFIALGAAAKAAWSDIQNAYNGIRVGTGALGNDLAGLKDSFRTVFADVPASAHEVSAALTSLNQLTGATGKSLEELTKQQVELAHITGAELKPQVEATVHAFNQWKIAADQQGPALDTLFRISQLTGVSVTQLATSLASGGASARVAGLSFETSALLIGQLSKAGIDADAIFKGFAITFKKLATKDPNADPATILQGFIAAIQKAGTTAEVNRLAIEAFGRSGVAMGQAIKDGRLNLEDLTKALANNHDTIGKAAEDVKTFGDRWTEFQHKLELALAPLGQEMGRILKSFLPDMDALANMIKQVSDAFAALPENARQATAAILVGFAVGGPIIAGLTAIVALLGGPLTAAMVVITGAAAVWAADWIDNMQASEKATVDLRDTMMTLAAALGEIMNVFGVLSHMVVGTIEFIANTFVTFFGIMTGQWSAAWQNMLNTLSSWKKEAVAAWDDLNGKWSDRLAGLVRTAYGASDAFGAAGKSNADAYSVALFGGIQSANARAKNFSMNPQGSWQMGGTVSDAQARAAYEAGTKPPLGSDWTFKTPGYAGTGMPTTPPIKLPNLGVAGKKAGGDLAKAMIDGFLDGFKGFEAAMGEINSATSAQLDALTDNLSKKAKVGLEKLALAFKDVTPVVNAFLSAQGIAATVTTAQLEEMAKAGDTSLLQYTEAWKRTQQDVNNAGIEMAERLPTSLKTVNEFLKAQGSDLVITAESWSKMDAAGKNAVVALAGLAKGQKDLNEELQVSGKAIEDVASAYLGHKQAVASAFNEYTHGKITLTEYLEVLDSVNGGTKIVAESSEGLGKKMETMGEAVRKALSEFAPLAAVREIMSSRGEIDAAITDFERYGEAMGKTGDALKRYVDENVAALASVENVTQTKLASVLEEHRRAAIQLPGIWDSVFRQMSSSAKSMAASIFGVLDSIPGAFGSTVKKVTDTISQWVKFFDSILGLLHKFVSAIPDSMGSAVSQVADIFKGAGSSAQGVANQIGGAWANAAEDINQGNSSISKSTGGMSESLKTALGAGASAAAGFALSMQIAANSSSKAMGFLGATVSATIAGITAGFAFGPIGGAIVGGLSLLGGVIGLFKGKSAAQKQQEALQLQQLKDQIAQDAQNIVNTALDGFNKALDFLNKLDDFTAARHANFRAFFAQLTKLMDWFVELAKTWGKDTLDKAKTFAESLGPIVDSITNAPLALQNIGQYIPIALSSIDRFFSDLGIVVTKMGTLADTIANDLQKRARKFAERVLPVTDVLKSAVEGLAGIMTFAGVPEAAMDFFGTALKMAVLKMTQIADSLDQSGVKAAARFADRAGVVTNLLKSGVDGLMALTTLTAIPADAFDIFFAGIAVALDRLGKLSDTLDSETLGKAVAIASAIIPIAGAMKAWAEASAAVKGYVAVTEQIWTEITQDFARALNLIDLMLASALEYVPKAETFQATMLKLAALLSGGLTAFSGGLTAAATQFGAVVGAIEGGIPFPGSSGAGSAGTLSARSSSTVIQDGAFPTTIILPPGSTDGDGAVARRIVREEFQRMLQSLQLIQSVA